MVNNIPGIPPHEPERRRERREEYDWGLRYYSSELFKLFLISKSMPRSSKEHEEIEKISKNLSLLLWIGKAQILNHSQESTIIDQIRYITENFHQNDLYAQTCDIVQIIKNLSPKTEILELFTEIEYEACLCKDKKHPSINPQRLQELFEKILIVMEQKSDKFSIMKLERELRQIQSIFHRDPSQINLLLHNLEQLIRQ